MTLKAMIFDLDGTLGDTLPVVVQAMQETFVRFAGRVYSSPEIFEMFGPSEEGVFKPRVRAEVYDQALQHYLERYAALHLLANRPFPGVLNLLERLKALGIHRGVVTGKSQGTARISLKAMGLDGSIENLAAGSPRGAEKPQALRSMLAEWNVRPEEAAYVGDAPYDISSAREAGLIALGAAWAATATVKANSGAHEIFFNTVDLLAWVEQRTGDPSPTR